ncbi:SxtJ family membrane protein [Aliiroseovarius subalbicans]|uniref:SxtJ family membrane protein n=1 Tax=Aliiroseovarius subalbicans TaxID=2925840 RepID=UPI001F588FF4|nr:SxtJ family membrane protein [uncultured Aliiroseovarius sp.]MCI2397767.1 SxtJ family membrane protein [Aliiroseovarius subalbicans]
MSTPTIGSEKSFGLVFCAVFLIIAFYPLLKGGDLRLWALIVAGLFGAVSFLMPRLLKPLNHAWFRFGLAISAVMTPVVMGILFALVVTPTALLMKLFGKDPLKRGIDPTLDSYWEPRDTPPGPMKNQF